MDIITSWGIAIAVASFAMGTSVTTIIRGVAISDIAVIALGVVCFLTDLGCMIYDFYKLRRV